VILEVAILDVRPGESSPFEAAFRAAEGILTATPGHLGHELHRCLEAPDRYLLLVRWQTLEDHTIGFRGSPEYQRWTALLHHFYDPFPTVEHYHRVDP
jgi:heme-degrading monooxygenase HmoA